MDYDVLVVGGSLSGAATATLLLQQDPALRILIVEKTGKFTRRVGEATVEVSGYFLSRILGLTHYLNENHLSKQGMRFWFANEATQGFDDASEIGGMYQVRLPSWQVDRSTMDEEILRRVVAMGAELQRPAKVSNIRLQPGGLQSATITTESGATEVRARWIVDASGIAAMVGRQNGWIQPNREHPTASAWARWRNVKDWDGAELAAKYPEWSQACYAVRHTATNHVVGDGWWSWWIPLKGGEMSVGVVFDQRLVDWPEEGDNVAEKLKAFLSRHPTGREMLERAEPVEGDAHFRRNLAYRSDKMAEDGVVLVGDAAAFMDPLYSPGMDWISFSAMAASELILAERRGEALEPLIRMHNEKLTESYARWFEAIYKDKYEYLGDFDLMSLAFRLDLGLYYLGVVSQPMSLGRKAFLNPPFSVPASRPVYWLAKTYNRRLAAMGRQRRKDRRHGMSNSSKRLLIPGFTPERKDAQKLLPLLFGWLKLELKEGWRSWGATEPDHAQTTPAAFAPAKAGAKA